ncbi:MAG: hypothetical protein M1826_007499 [Phylliscum demangeonii]|nr:MAG: hypothetical protein M1826_007499 [Phylliscum demangeonii]
MTGHKVQATKAAVAHAPSVASGSLLHPAQEQADSIGRQAISDAQAGTLGGVQGRRRHLPPLEEGQAASGQISLPILALLDPGSTEEVKAMGSLIDRAVVLFHACTSSPTHIMLKFP